MTDMSVCWGPGIFKILGIRFSTDTELVSEINYDGKLTEIRKILNKWSKRQLTLLGNITVIKILAISKIAQLFINIPYPPELFLRKLEADFLKFLWGGKASKNV